MRETAEDILVFWFGELVGDDDVDRSKSDLWWAGGADADRQIRERFGDDMARALAGELDGWMAEPRSCLALVILLDQFTRVIGRGTGAAFAGDAKAVAILEGAIKSGQDRALRLIERTFFYMPMMHGEDRATARRSVEIYEALSKEIKAAVGDDFPDSFGHAVEHAQIVERFGRFPHRNAALGRTPTDEETAYLAGGGKSFNQ